MWKTALYFLDNLESTKVLLLWYCIYYFLKNNWIQYLMFVKVDKDAY